MKKNIDQIIADHKALKRKKRIVLIFYIILMCAIWIGGIFVYKWAINDYGLYKMSIAPGLKFLSLTQFVWRSTIIYLILLSCIVSFPFMYVFHYVLIIDKPKKRKLPLH